jgi:hypothetical protein
MQVTLLYRAAHTLSTTSMLPSLPRVSTMYTIDNIDVPCLVGLTGAETGL